MLALIRRVYSFEITVQALITTNSTSFSEHNTALYWLEIETIL
jgi:hypothetical protein